MAQKKASKKGGAAAAAPKEMLLVQSKLKEYVRGKGLNVASDLAEAVNAEVYKLLDAAARRAEANGRKTARAGDV